MNGQVCTKLLKFLEAAAPFCISNRNEQEFLFHIFNRVSHGSVFGVLVILICNFLMTCKIGSLEICLFSVLLHLLQDALQILCPFFWVNLLSSLLLSFKSSLCILVSSPLSYRCFPNTFCQAAACLSYLQCLSQSRIEFHLSEVHLVDSFIHLLCFQCFIAEHKVIQVFSC
jgi:hypothetical protein